MPDDSAAQSSQPTGLPRIRPGGRARDVTNRIFAATVHILTESGYGSLAFQDIARDAAVSRTTLYRRWPSVAALALDAVTEVASERVVAPDTGTLRGDLRGLVRSLADFLTSPVGTAVLTAELEMGLPTDPSSARSSFWVRRRPEVSPALERAIARGEIPADIDIDSAIAMALGAVYFRLLVMAAPADDPWISHLVDVCIANWQR
jgi:AcrR family transcriptional regulator